MDKWRKQIITYKSINWLLVALILLLTLLPAHYHLHHLHDDDSHRTEVHGYNQGHDHAIDLHLLTNKTGQSHHDEDAINITASPDGIVKKSNPAFSPFALLVIVLALLPVSISRFRLFSDRNNTNLRHSYLHFSPPLRAPPL
jgi:hypothetical protein